MRTVIKHFLLLFIVKIIVEKSLKKNRVLYFHKKPDGEIFYVGIGNKYRPYSKKGRNKWWHNTVKKYGYNIDIIYENLSSQEAIEKECYYIKELGRSDLGLGKLVNMTDGGDGCQNREQTQETKIKISENSAKFWLGKKMLIEMIKKLSESHIGIQAGEKHPFFGKHHSQEAKNKIGAAHLGMKHSEKSLKKMSDAKLGKIKTKKHRENLSIALTGKKKSDEHRKNISISKTGKELTKIQKEANKKNGENRVGSQLSIETRNKIAESARKRNIELGLKVSQYKGVVWDKVRSKWKVNIYRNGKNNFLGYFDNEKEASKKYNEFIETKF